MKVALTKEGEDLANSDIVKLVRVSKPVDLSGFKSIMERDHTQYYCWLYDLKAKAIAVSKTQLA